MTEATAIRTWKVNSKGKTSATVEVHIPIGKDRSLVSTLGGKRAERAKAAIVAAWGEKDPAVWGLRADVGAAQAEAHRLATQTEMRTRHGMVPVNTAREAYAVIVTEG